MPRAVQLSSFARRARGELGQDLVVAGLGVRLGPANEAASPRTVRDLRSQLRSFGPELESSAGARDVARFLISEPPLPWAARPGFWLLVAGALEMLPPHARDLLDLHLPRPLRPLEEPLLRYAAGPLGALGTAAVGWALGDPGDLRNAEGSSAVA